MQGSAAASQVRGEDCAAPVLYTLDMKVARKTLNAEEGEKKELGRAA
jgi:hypothetical protein